MNLDIYWPDKHCRTRTSLIVWAVFATCNIALAEGKAAVHQIDLKQDFLGFAELKSSQNSPRLAIFTSTGQHQHLQRLLHWFEWNGEELKSLRSVPLKDHFATHDICQVDRKDLHHQSLVTLSSKGVYSLSLKRWLVESPSFYAHPRQDEFPYLRTCFKLNPQQPDVILVPTLNGADLFIQDPKGIYQKSLSMNADAEMRYMGQITRPSSPQVPQRIVTTINFPDVGVVDFNGNARKDICFTGKHHLKCYLQSEHGHFTEDDTISHYFDIREENELDQTSIQHQVYLVDLNANGRADIVVKKSTFNLNKMFGELHTFKQKSSGDFPAHADQVIRREGYFDFHEFLDFNGNGFVDIVAPVRSLGWTQIAGIYLSGSIGLSFEYFPNLDGTFSEQSVKIAEYSIPLDFDRVKSFVGGLPIWKLKQPLDTNRNLMVLFPEKKSIQLTQRTFHENDKLKMDTLWEKKVPIGSQVFPVDLDSDGRVEFVIGYGSDKKMGQKINYLRP